MSSDSLILSLQTRCAAKITVIPKQLRCWVQDLGRPVGGACTCVHAALQPVHAMQGLLPLHYADRCTVCSSPLLWPQACVHAPCIGMQQGGLGQVRQGLPVRIAFPWQMGGLVLGH